MHPNIATLANHLQAENAHDLSGTLATLHPSCVFTDHATGERWLGLDGARIHYEEQWESLDVTVERAPKQFSFWNADFDLYTAQALWRGRHRGEFRGMAASGCSFTHAFAVFVRFRDGLMIAEDFFYDLESLSARLGQHEPAMRAQPFPGTAR